MMIVDKEEEINTRVLKVYAIPVFRSYQPCERKCVLLLLYIRTL